VNCEPLNEELTTKPSDGVTEAVTEPLANLLPQLKIEKLVNLLIENHHP
jgi:hypothetical protein